MISSEEPDGTIVLGFDIRHPLDDLSFSRWDQERRAQYLIRPEVRWPVSVDPVVWPAPSAEQVNQHPLSLWSSVAEVLAACPAAASHGSSAESNIPVVIEIGALRDSQSVRYWERIMEGFVQPEADDAGQYATDSFGYDVADRYLLSGLSNCGLSAEEIGIVRKQFAAQINPFGLFSDPVVAADFRVSCDQLVPEHAPFCIYRIRRIKPLPRGMLVV